MLDELTLQSLDNNFFMLLQAIGMGDMGLARAFTFSFCQEHASLFDPDFIEWIMNQLTTDIPEPNTPEPSAPSIPREIENLVVCEDVSQTFNINRYWVSNREKKLLDEIIGLCHSSELLTSAKIPFANTTLLYGPPGVGKTQFGRYLAYEMGLPFVYVDLCRVIGSQMGETGRNLQQIFEFVGSSKCLFMLDEIDSIGANRGSISTGGSGDEMTRTTLALMQCMDRLPQNVVLLAATNRPDMMDSALKRRFTIKHEFKHFVPDELCSMVVCYLEDVNKTGNLGLSWSADDIRTQCGINTSQSELINLCNRAIVRAIRGDRVVKLEVEEKRQRTMR